MTDLATELYIPAEEVAICCTDTGALHKLGKGGQGEVISCFHHSFLHPTLPTWKHGMLPVALSA